MNIEIHFILDGNIKCKVRANHAPRVGDEMRIGGEGNESYYEIIRLCWAYDEPKNGFDRVNIEIAPVKD